MVSFGLIEKFLARLFAVVFNSPRFIGWPLLLLAI